MGITVLLSILIIVANMVVDIMYGFLDPRTRDGDGLADGRMSIVDPQTELVAGDEQRAAGTSRPARRSAQASLWRDALRRFTHNKAARHRDGRVRAMLALRRDRPVGLAVRPERGRLLASRTSRRPAPPVRHRRVRPRPVPAHRARRPHLDRRSASPATLAIMVVGILYGAISGFVGGWLDNAMMRFLDALYGLPYLPFAIITLAIFGDGQLLDDGRRADGRHRGSRRRASCAARSSR